MADKNSRSQHSLDAFPSEADAMMPGPRSPHTRDLTLSMGDGAAHQAVRVVTIISCLAMVLAAIYVAYVALQSLP